MAQSRVSEDSKERPEWLCMKEAGKPVIAVDLDEVLGRFVSSFCAFDKEKNGATLTPNDYFSYDFSKVWKMEWAPAVAKVETFFKTPYFSDMEVIPEAKTALAALRKNFNFVVVTSRQNSIADTTRNWLKKYFPGIFFDVKFGNHWTDEGEPIPKPVLCKQVGAICLIDDNVGYAEECARMENFNVVLFGDYAWNRTQGKLATNITRAVSWKEATQALLKLIKRAK